MITCSEVHSSTQRERGGGVPVPTLHSSTYRERAGLRVPNYTTVHRGGGGDLFLTTHQYTERGVVVYLFLTTQQYTKKGAGGYLFLST